jgi:hypothetical protein
MNPVLNEVLQTCDGIPKGEGEFLQDIVLKNSPRISLEIGFAYGISALFICEALQKVKGEKHIVIDPKPYSSFNGIGIKNVRKAKYENLIEFIEAPSELGLPNLLKEGTRVDFAFIDGWHTFDHALIDFFYINRLLNVGGIIAFDDANWQSVNRLCRYVSRYPCYKIHSVWPAKQNFGGLTFTAKILEYFVTRQMMFWKADLSFLRRRCVAFKKVREDNRDFGWYLNF